METESFRPALSSSIIDGIQQIAQVIISYSKNFRLKLKKKVDKLHYLFSFLDAIMIFKLEKNSVKIVSKPGYVPKTLREMDQVLVLELISPVLD